MNISNGVFKSVLMNWDSFTFPVMEGTPVSAAGEEANTGDAIGLLPQSVAEKPLIPDCPQFADFYYMGADGSCISDVCLILLSKSVYMGQTEVSASFESKGTGYTGTWTRSGFSLTSN